MESKEIMNRLQDPFAEDQIEWKVQQGGFKNNAPWAIILAYVNNRSIMNRLDEVFGIDGWQNEYKPGPLGGVICGLKCKVNDVWLAKWDGSDNTKIEPVKGGLSDSMKRAAVQWGIGRYLYNLPMAFATFADKARFRCEIKDDNKKHYLKYNPPTLPDWALPRVCEDDPVEWIQDKPEIKKLCDGMGLKKTEIVECIMDCKYKEDKVLEYLNGINDLTKGAN